MRRAFKIFICVVVLVAVISTVNYCSRPYSTQTVTYFEYEKSIKGKGYILRDETIVTNDAPGVFEPFVNDGERVSKDAKVGTVISGSLDEKLIEELNQVKERIEDIEKSSSIAGLYQSDELRISNAVKNDIKSLRTAVKNSDLSKATELKKEIGYLKDRSAQIENNESRTELLAQLYQRRDDIEAAVGGVQHELYSPIAGVYSLAIDGLEKYGKEDTLAGLTPSEVENFDKELKEYEKDPHDVCKITDNFNWYLAAVISVEDAKNVRVGNRVTIKIDNSDTSEVQGTVYSLSEEEDGKNVMIVKSNLFIEGISSVRTVDYEVILQRRTGLKIPSAALRIEDGKKGVYILIDKKKSFRFVNDNPFRSEDDQYYIVDRKYTPQGASAEYVPLKEYDKVLLNPEDVR